MSNISQDSYDREKESNKKSIQMWLEDYAEENGDEQFITSGYAFNYDLPDFIQSIIDDLYIPRDDHEKELEELRNKTIEECKQEIEKFHLIREDGEELADTAECYNKALDDSISSLQKLKSQPAMKLFTAEEAYDLAYKAVTSDEVFLNKALKQAFGVEGK